MPTSTTVGSISGGHETFTGLAERQIRHLIMSGELEPGQKVNEVELSEGFEISRGPIREAIQRLASEGLLSIRNHRGAVVRVFDADEIRDLFGVRVALEGYAIREGAERAEDQQLATLRTMTRAAGRAEATDRDDSLDIDFHRSIVLLAGNAALLEAHSAVMQKIALAGSRGRGASESGCARADEHIEVLDALVARDGGTAAQLLESHILATLQTADPTAGSSQRPSTTG